MKTVTVRIPVAVFGDGDWGVSSGSSTDDSDELLVNLKSEWGPHDRAIHWITAEVPVPEPREVRGRVEG